MQITVYFIWKDHAVGLESHVERNHLIFIWDWGFNFIVRHFQWRFVSFQNLHTFSESLKTKFSVEFSRRNFNSRIRPRF